MIKKELTINALYRTRAFQFLYLILCFSIFTFHLSLFASVSEAAQDIGKFTSVEGKVDVMRAGALPATPVKTGDSVFLKDIIRTKSGSMADITFIDGNVLKLSQRSRIDISEYVSESRGIIRLSRGRVEAVVPKNIVKNIEAAPKANRFEIHTPCAVSGVRGTDFIVFHTRYSSSVVVKEGIVYIYNPKFPDLVTVVKEGFSTRVPLNAPPQSPLKGSEPVIFMFEGDGSLSPAEKMDMIQVPVTVPITDIPGILPTKQGDFERLQ